MSESERGSSLIWFVSLLAVVLMVLLILASSIHQYLFARSLTDYTEQLALAGKTMLNQGVSLSDLETKFRQLPEFGRELTALSISFTDQKTLVITTCSNWVSPITVLSASREICERALAR